MKKIITIIMLIVITGAVIVGCTQASRVSTNLSKEADSFNIIRQLIAFNQRTDKIIFVAVGNFSIEKEMDGDLAIIGENPDGTFYKHFIYLSSEVGYTCEQLTGLKVSKYQFTINYNPEYIGLFDFDYIN